MKYLKAAKLQLALALALIVGVFCGLDPAIAAGCAFALTTTGQLGNGTRVFVSGGSPTALVEVGNVRNVEFDNGSSAKVDMTNLASTWKEFLLGLPDPGSLTFEVDYNIADVGQAMLRASRINRQKCDFQILLPSGTTPTATMQGFVCKFPIQTSVDNPIKTQVEAFLTGPIVLS